MIENSKETRSKALQLRIWLDELIDEALRRPPPPDGSEMSQLMNMLGSLAKGGVVVPQGEAGEEAVVEEGRQRAEEVIKEIVEEGEINAIADQSDEAVDHTISNLESQAKILEATETD